MAGAWSALRGRRSTEEKAEELAASCTCERKRRGPEQSLEDCEVAPCLLVTAHTLHLEMLLVARAGQRAHAAWPGRAMQVRV
jgi:hypothetical protein